MIHHLRVWFYRRFHRLAIDRDEAVTARIIKRMRMHRAMRKPWGWP